MTEGQPAARSLWHTVRWPVVALVTTVFLLLIGLVLDTLPPGSGRELALVIGGPALTVLLPLSLLWLVASFVRHDRRRRRRRQVMVKVPRRP